MGLDMYLTRKTYVKNWDHYKPEERWEVTVHQGGKPNTAIRPERISYIEEEVAYWRKANAIHKWFVDNCQDGNDDCREGYVSREQLHMLLDAVIKVLDAVRLVEGEVHTGTTYTAGRKTENYESGKIIANPEVAVALLPTQGGFFFGGTDYDQFYLDDLAYTRDTLTALLAEPVTGEIYYHSSW